MNYYLYTLAIFPRHKEITPSSFTTLTKQSPIPVYCFDNNFGLLCYVYNNNLTLSNGAQIVLAITPAVYF